MQPTINFDYCILQHDIGQAIFLAFNNLFLNIFYSRECKKQHFTKSDKWKNYVCLKNVIIFSSLRTSETNYLNEAFSFYAAIRGRAYYSRAVREDRYELLRLVLYLVLCIKYMYYDKIYFGKKSLIEIILTWKRLSKRTHGTLDKEYCLQEFFVKSVFRTKDSGN